MSGHKAKASSFLLLYSKLHVKVQPAACLQLPVLQCACSVPAVAAFACAAAVAGGAAVAGAACAAAVPLSEAGTNAMTPG